LSDLEFNFAIIVRGNDTPRIAPDQRLRIDAAWDLWDKKRMNKELIDRKRKQVEDHLFNELLPFWTSRCKDDRHGGFISHFDRHGNDSGENEKSLVAQSRMTYIFASVHRAGVGDGLYAEFAKHGVDFLVNKMWDSEQGGFFWIMDREGNPVIDKKILFGHSFAIYALSEYTLATGDPVGLEYAEKTFDLIQRHCSDSAQPGYYEMFDRSWKLAGPGSQGGDRKTLDVHMHLMEAFTNLYECSGKREHREKLLDVIDILLCKTMHPVHGTGIPQFTSDWRVASQIKFDIVWGWDRFSESGDKTNAEDNTSFGHNVELSWLLLHALDVLGIEPEKHEKEIRKLIDHAVDHGLDREYGGVYVEGLHGGGCHDREKEFWQQAEVMVGLLDACRLYGMERYWPAYELVHDFVFEKVINHSVGEWWPLLTREGEPIWTHMSHSWKVNYHTVRSMLQCRKRLKKLA
jgi:mannose 2-epimerase